MLYRNCGRRIPDNSKFCVNCGIKIKDDISGYVRQRVIADSAKSFPVSDKIITYKSDIIKNKHRRFRNDNPQLKIISESRLI